MLIKSLSVAGILVCLTVGSVHATTIDISLMGDNSLGAFDYPQHVFARHVFGGLSEQNPVTVANGDTVNVTLTFNASVYLRSSYGAAIGQVPNDSLGLTFTGSVSGTIEATGTMDLYESGQQVFSGKLNGVGIGNVYDSAALGAYGMSFDTLKSTFSVSGLTAAAVLQRADLSFIEFPPTQLSVPSPIGDTGTVSLVPEPSVASLALTALAVAGLGRSRRSRARATGR
jgi:hypothetical protein